MQFSVVEFFAAAVFTAKTHDKFGVFFKTLGTNHERLIVAAIVGIVATVIQQSRIKNNLAKVFALVAGGIAFWVVWTVFNAFRHIYRPLFAAFLSPTTEAAITNFSRRLGSNNFRLGIALVACLIIGIYTYLQVNSAWLKPLVLFPLVGTFWIAWEIANHWAIPDEPLFIGKYYRAGQLVDVFLTEHTVLIGFAGLGFSVVFYHIMRRKDAKNSGENRPTSLLGAFAAYTAVVFLGLYLTHSTVVGHFLA